MSLRRAQVWISCRCLDASARHSESSVALALGPAIAQQAAGHVTRRVGSALLDLLRVPCGVRAPARVRLHLSGAVLLVLEPLRRSERLVLLPAVLQHEAVGGALCVHGDGAAGAELLELPRFRLAGERGQHDQSGTTSPCPAHPPSLSLAAPQSRA